MKSFDTASESCADLMVAEVPKQASLLGLPAELRNEIYDCVAAQPGEIIIREGKIVPPALARTCRQIRSEFLPLFQTSSGCRPTAVKVYVKDLDFCGLTDQLKRFSLPTRTPRGPQVSLTAALEVNKYEMTVSKETALSDWCQFHTHASRNHLALVYKYEVRVACEALGSKHTRLVGLILEQLRERRGESYMRLMSSSSREERQLKAWLEGRGVLREW